MADEFFLTGVDGMYKISSYTHDHFRDGGGPLKFVATESKSNGKWGMARLWRKWMSVTADYMAANGSKMPLMIKSSGEWYGSRPFNANDAHELFTAQWLGVNEHGDRLSWKRSQGANVADKGQRFLAMLKHEHWCIEKGINLPQPRNSELHDLKEEHNGITNL